MKFRRSTFCITAIALLQSCALSTFPVTDRWEGIRDRTLRVYVRFAKNSARQEDDLINMYYTVGDSRAEQIKWCFENRKSMNGSIELKQNSLHIKKRGIAFATCNRKYCEAFIDYDIVK